MAFRDCILSAVRQGAISRQEADDIIARYEAHLSARRAAGEANPERAARDSLASQFDNEAARSREFAQMGEDKRGEIAEHLHNFRSYDGTPDVYEASMRLLENFGFSGTSSVTGRARAILGIAHGEMEGVLRAFERNFYTGMRHQAVLARDLVHEVLGQSTGNEIARAFAGAVSEQFEKLRTRFNAAGGDIARIEGGYIPQFHDPIALLKVGFEKWRDDIRPRLDPARMRDPLTGEIGMTPERLEASLRPAYDQITTEGWATREPSTQPQGRGALANQRQEHRFFAFTRPDDWLWYDRQYGHGDPIKAVFGHINSMARDIAAMEILGPNPSATVEWLKQVVQSEHGKWLAGNDSLFTPSSLTGLATIGEKDAGKAAAKKIEDLWYFVRGRETVHQGVSDFFGNVRNALTTAQLGSAVITAAAVDPAIDRMARRQLGMADRELFGSNLKVYADGFAQLPIVRHALLPVVDYFTGQPRAQAARAGMVVDEFLHILGDEARYAGTLSGSVWSRWMADRTVTLTGLEPLTQARRAVFQLDLMGHIADYTDRAFTELPDLLRTKMEGYGFDAAAWDRMRSVPHHTPDQGASGFLRPVDVAQVDRGLGERLAEMIAGETERAVPTSTLRSKAYILGSRPKGQGVGELLEGFLQYKSFGLSVVTLQAEAVAHEAARTGRAGGASYAGQLLLLTTLGGALGIQLKALINGKDPQDMADPKFWGAAIANGGGMGVMGDFMFADVNRYGYSFPEQLAGPTASLVSDIAKFTMGNAMELMQRKDTHAAHEAVQNLGKYTPFASSSWYTRLAYRREIIDQLDYLADPQAHKRWREQEHKMNREKGQGFWWPPGETAPTRTPEMRLSR